MYLILKSRCHMKKTVYAIPFLIVLAALLCLTDAKAGFGKPPNGLTWN